jgi:cobalt-zinc-cadmium efflux system protein
VRGHHHNREPAGYSHDEHLHKASGDVGYARLILSVALNLLITIVEVIGGILSGSLALLSDALHNFADTSSLGVSLAARIVARRSPDRRMTFGYGRAEIIGAFVNLLSLAFVAVWLVKEAVERLADPQPIALGPMLIVATIGLAANITTALLLRKPSRDSFNLKSAYVHILTDAMSSVAVILAGLLIAWRGWLWVDPILSVAIAFYICYFSVSMLRRTALVLMQAVPPEIDIASVIVAVEENPLVNDAHNVHVWQLDERSVALEAHVCIDYSSLHQMEKIKDDIKVLLASRFGILHSTLEFETGPCGERPDPRPQSAIDPLPHRHN